MISSLRRWSIAALVAALAALVAAWFRHREPEVLDEAAPGTAAWPPLIPIQLSTWVAPDAEGCCPITHPVKAKESSGIYHVVGGLAYERTNADRCYADRTAAEADGFRASKR